MKIFYIGKRKAKKEDMEKNGKENIPDNPIKMIFKKNQIVLLAISLMLITAGYMNYNNNNKNSNLMVAELGDAELVSSETVTDTMQDSDVDNYKDNQTTKNKTETVNAGLNSTNNEIENNLETNTVNSKVDETNYFTKTRIEREKMYSQMLETYEKILENEKIPNDQKSIATNEIKSINDKENAISIIENLIKNKGFSDVVILINDNNIDAIVKTDNIKELKDDEIAQIESIVSRQLNAEIADIHISVHK